MIASLRGTLILKALDSIVLEVGGVGYRIFLSARSMAHVPSVGSETQVLTYLQVREDALILYGFSLQEEKELFERLIGVSGVGPKVALSALSTYEASALISAIAAQDIAAIQRIPGVGKKMASRIVLELKDAFDFSGDIESPLSSGVRSQQVRKGVVEALLSMGFTSSEAELALKGSPEEASEPLLLQYALKRLGE